jgi:hypothetical protein
VGHPVGVLTDDRLGHSSSATLGLPGEASLQVGVDDDDASVR